MADKAEIYRTV